MLGRAGDLVARDLSDLIETGTEWPKGIESFQVGSSMSVLERPARMCRFVDVRGWDVD